MSRAMAAIVFACGLAACANYRAVGEFGARTEELTQVVRQEVKQVDALCVEQAELNALLSDDAGESALKDCAAYQAAQSRFAGMTLDVLDNYARALKAIADGSRFDLDPELDNLSGKLQGLAANGQPLVGAAERTALSQVAKILADLVTTRKRDQAVRRLVSETPNLATTGNILRRYFAGPASPYQNIVGIIGETASSNARLLKQARVREAEPIRTAELSRAARDGRQMLEARNSSAADGVRAQMAAAIDAWQSALQSFAKQALEPDPRELGDRLKELRKRVKVAYRAIEGNGQ